MKQEGNWRRLGRFLAHCFFPNRCPFCGRCIAAERHACPQCEREERSASGLVRTGCRRDGKHYDAVYAPFRYGERGRRAVADLKFRDETHNARHLGYYQAAFLEENGCAGQFDAAVPVPMSRKKRRRRGYNQAALLARAVGFYLGIPCLDVLEKKWETAEQHTLSAGERKQNLRDAYRAADPAPVRGKRLLLIDDVFTTGATVDECAKTLLEAGAARVTVSAACAVGHAGGDAENGPGPGETENSGAEP